MPTTAGLPRRSVTCRRARPRSVERLIAAGAICIGKTNLDQLATGLSGARSPYGACASAFDPRYVSGGSSSGSAVAVAARPRRVRARHRHRRPRAAFPQGSTTIVGIKPTVGLVSSRGLVPNCPTLDCVSIFCNSVRDGATILEIIEGFDAEDSLQPALPQRRSARGQRRSVQVRPHRSKRPSNSSACPNAALPSNRPATDLPGLGGTAVEIDFAPFAEAGQLMLPRPPGSRNDGGDSALMEVDSDSASRCDQGRAAAGGRLFGDRRLHLAAPAVATAPCRCRTSSPASMRW